MRAWGQAIEKRPVAFLLFLALFGTAFVMLYQPLAQDDGATHYLALWFFPLFCAVYAYWLWAPSAPAESVAGSVAFRLHRHQAGLIAVLASAFFFEVWPTSLVCDDGAIILRYMENFATGHFYTYNPEGPPVFGVSGFLHGLFAGILAFTHVLSPLNSMFASNFAGLVLVYFFTFKILEHYIQERAWVFPAWALAVLSSPVFLFNVWQGMETPLHLGIALACFHLYLRNSRWLWPVLALSIISKLDAVPMVAVLGLAALIKNRAALRPYSWKNAYWRNMVLWAVLPLLLWILFTTLVFGSPLPNSGYAKFVMRTDTSGNWWAFFTAMPDKPVQWASFLIILGHFMWRILQGRLNAFDELILGFSAAAIYALFLSYNPAEKMTWYFVLPDYLTKLQVIVIVWIALRAFALRWAAVKACFVFGVFCYSVLPHTLLKIAAVISYTSVAQAEWMVAGEWIDEHAPKGATVETGLGYPAWKCRREVLDNSGLNSPEVIRRFQAGQPAVPPDELRDYLISLGRLPANQSYRLVRGYYNHVQFGGEPLFVYEKAKKKESTSEEYLSGQELQSSGIVLPQGAYVMAYGSRFRITPRGGRFRAERFAAGFRLQRQPLVLHVRWQSRAATAQATAQEQEESITLPPGSESDYALFSREWQFTLPKENVEFLEITAQDAEGGPASTWMYAPLFVGVPE